MRNRTSRAPLARTALCAPPLLRSHFSPSSPASPCPAVTVNRSFTDEFLSDLHVASRGGTGTGVAFIVQELAVPAAEQPALLESLAAAKQPQGGRSGSSSAVLGDFFKVLEARTDALAERAR